MESTIFSELTGTFSKTDQIILRKTMFTQSTVETICDLSYNRVTKIEKNNKYNSQTSQIIGD